MENQTDSNEISMEVFREHLHQRLQENRTMLQQINQTIDQSQGEITRLGQKKSLVTARLQQFQGELEGITKEEIRDSFVEAMDSQQRLLLMRNQLEKLNEQRNYIVSANQSLEEVERILQMVDEKIDSKNSRSTSLETLEMLINAQEAERQRLSRQMHDGPAQALSNFIVQAEIATKLFDIDPAKARDELDKLKNSAMNTFQKIRLFVSEIRPMMLDDLGLIPTLKKHISEIKETSGVELLLTINGSERKLEPYLEVFIFRTVQELVNNAIKRNQSCNNDFRIEVVLTISDTDLNLLVGDNGRVFSSTELTATDGLGLNLIKERTEMLGGEYFCNINRISGVEINIHIPVVETPEQA